MRNNDELRKNFWQGGLFQIFFALTELTVLLFDFLLFHTKNQIKTIDERSDFRRFI